MAHDVFISYSHSDKAAADATCAALEAKHIRCWIAPRDIAPGAEWGESIIDAIGKARVAIVIFSSRADASPQVRREVERAVSQGVTIVPVRVELAEPTRALAYFMAGVHWLDAMTPPFETHLERLATSIKAYLETTSAEASPPRSEAAPAQGLTGAAATALAGGPIGTAERPVSPRADGPVGAPSTATARAESAPAPTKPPRTTGRRIVRWVGFAVLGVVVLFIGIPIAIFAGSRLFGPSRPTRTIDVPTAAIVTVGFGATSFLPGLRTSADMDDVAAGGGDLYTGCSLGAPTSSCSAHLTDYAVRTWDTDGKLLSTYGGNDGPTADIAWTRHHGGNQMIAVAREAKVVVWNFQTGAVIMSVAKGAQRVVFSPDDSLLATSNGDIYRVDDGRVAATMSPECANISDVSPDGTRVVVDHDDAIPTMRVCDIGTGKMLFELKESDDTFVHRPLYIADDKIMAAGRVWDAKTGQSLPAFDVGTTMSTVSADRRFVATVDGSRIRIWNGKTLAPIKDVSSPAGPSAIALSADGGWLAAGAEKVVELYDLH